MENQIVDMGNVELSYFLGRLFPSAATAKERETWLNEVRDPEEHPNPWIVSPVMKDGARLGYSVFALRRTGDSMDLVAYAGY